MTDDPTLHPSRTDAAGTDIAGSPAWADAGLPGRAMPRRRPVRRAHPNILWAILTLCAALIAVAGFLAWSALNNDASSSIRERRDAEAAANAPSILKPSEIPKVDPVTYLDVPQDEARKINAAIAFSTRPNPAAAAFRPALSVVDSARAIDCLAAAAWYEAGDDAIGEQAVVQVVLNRLRHPAFPKTMCGVVFQGSERTTGCQFSFACDGAMRRTPSKAAWDRARNAAIGGINGLVFAPVGLSTHYHTDWVVPYWSSSVDKTAAIHTHLFFRWKGKAGEPRAFSNRYDGGEPLIPSLARLSPAHGAPETGETIVADIAPPPVATLATDSIAPVVAVTPVGDAALRGNALAERNPARNVFAIRIADDAFAGGLALMALDLCRLQPAAPCTVYGAAKGGNALAIDGAGKLGSATPLPDFYYFRDTARGRETALWNCATYKRPDPRQCMKNEFRPD